MFLNPAAVIQMDGDVSGPAAAVQMDGDVPHAAATFKSVDVCLYCGENFRDCRLEKNG